MDDENVEELINDNEIILTENQKKMILYSKITSQTSSVVNSLLFSSGITCDEADLIDPKFWKCAQTLDSSNKYSRIWCDYIGILGSNEKYVDPSSSDVKILQVGRIIPLVQNTLIPILKSFSRENIVEILAQLSTNSSIDECKLNNKKATWIKMWYEENFHNIIKRILKLTFLEHHKKYKDAVGELLFDFKQMHDICLINDASAYNELVLDAETINVVLKFVAGNKNLIINCDSIFSFEVPLPHIYVSSYDHLSTTEYCQENIAKRFDQFLNFIRNTVDDNQRADFLSKMKDQLKSTNSITKAKTIKGSA